MDVSGLYTSSDVLRAAVVNARMQMQQAEEAYLAKIFTDAITQLAENPAGRIPVKLKRGRDWFATLQKMFEAVDVKFYSGHADECPCRRDSDNLCSCAAAGEESFIASMVR